ncbi:MAG: copper-translocating P-type ATPase [Candidatus Hydrogenedentota bacterium]
MGHEHHEHHAHDNGGGHEHSHREHHAHMMADFKRRFFISLVLTVPVLTLSPMLQGWAGLEETLDFPGDLWVSLVFSAAVFFYGGWPFLKGAWDELSDTNPGMMTLIGLAISVAFGYSAVVVFGVPGRVFFWELATLVDVMLLGHWIEMRSVMSASGALEDLVKQMPSTAHRITQGDNTQDVPVADLQPDNVVLVKPGEKFPVDGLIEEGRTSVNAAMITGESKAVEKGPDDEVIGGTVNGESAVKLRVRKTGDETYLAQVVQMVQEAQQSKSRAQGLADRAAFWLTLIALTAGGVTLAGWLIGGREFVFALERMVTVMVITCPHALGLAVPLVVAMTTAIGARNGVLIRNRTPFEQARQLDAVVFDKTGTLTRGEFGVTDIEPLGDTEADKALALAAALERQSEHPIGAGIAVAAQDKDLELPSVKDFEAIPGKGAKGNVDGKDVKVVSPGYLKENDIDMPKEPAASLAAEGKTVVYVLVDEAPQAVIALEDLVRDTAKEAVSALQEQGVKTYMITGDSESVAQAVAKKMGIDDYFAEVLPDKKAAKIRALKNDGLRVAMVGDGVNDAPALAEADLGIAIGAGTDVAMETADVVLVHSDPRHVLYTRRLSRANHTKTIQNLWWAAGYNIAAIPLAAGVLVWAGIVLSPAVGALLMSLSTVIVAINARLMRMPGAGAEA